MTHPLTPREKVAAFLKERDEALGTIDADDAERHESAGLIITALASGSGDHAELARLAEGAERHWSNVDIAIGGNPIASDLVGLFVGAFSPALALALLAENAALRDRATEAERKLAEAVGLLKRIDRTYADMQDGNGNHPTELRKVRAFLSKEAERG